MEKHQRKIIYADHAATTPLRAEALAAMEPWLRSKFGNPSSQYRLGLEARQGIELARRRIAACLGCRSEEIYFTSGGSEGNTWTIWNAMAGSPARRTVLTTSIEHHSLLNACKSLEPFGLTAAFLPMDGEGRVSSHTLAEGLERHPTAFVSVQFANNETGTIQDITALARTARERGVPFHTDAVQAVGHIPIVLENIDYMTASAHKFGGPKGVGFLYARRGRPLRPLICGGSQESGLRGGTENVAAVAGMAAALESAMNEMEEQAEKLRRIETAFIALLRAGWRSARFNGGTDHLPGLLSVTLPGWKAEKMVYHMDMAGVCISAGAACDSRGKPEPSHVLTALGLHAHEAECTIRFSFGCSSLDEDGQEAARRLLNILRTG